MHQPRSSESVVRRVRVGRRVLVIRLARREDAAGLVDLFDSLAFDDRYARFFSAFRPNDAFVERLATGNDRGACSLVAVMVGDDGTERIVGEAGAWPLPNGDGELAITVASDSRGWLGPYLLDALLEVAASLGMPNLEAEVLATNRRMHALLRDRGAAVADHDGYATMRVVISTVGTVPSWPDDDRVRVLVETPGARWNASAVASSRGMSVIACSGPASRPARRPCPALKGETCPLVMGADAVVVRMLQHEADVDLAAAHEAVHPGVPVCVQTAEDDTDVVALVDRVEVLATRQRGK